MSRCFVVLFVCAVVAGCSSAPEPVRTSHIDGFDSAAVENAFVPSATSEPVEWRFEGAGSTTGGWTVVNGITDLAVSKG